MSSRKKKLKINDRLDTIAIVGCCWLVFLVLLKSYTYFLINTFLYDSNNIHQYFSFTHDSISLHDRIKNTLNPDWTKTFSVDYEVDASVSIFVKIFDAISKANDKDMGSAVFEMGVVVVGAKGSIVAKEIEKGGTLFINARKVEGTGGLLNLRLNGIKLTITEGFLKKPDPFYEISRKDNGLR